MAQSAAGDSDGAADRELRRQRLHAFAENVGRAAQAGPPPASANTTAAQLAPPPPPASFYSPASTVVPTGSTGPLKQFVKVLLCLPIGALAWLLTISVGVMLLGIVLVSVGVLFSGGLEPDMMPLLFFVPSDSGAGQDITSYYANYLSGMGADRFPRLVSMIALGGAGFVTLLWSVPAIIVLFAGLHLTRASTHWIEIVRAPIGAFLLYVALSVVSVVLVGPVYGWVMARGLPWLDGLSGFWRYAALYFGLILVVGWGNVKFLQAAGPFLLKLVRGTWSRNARDEALRALPRWTWPQSVRNALNP